jgi:uncharacterized membrane protein YheB (UPF0754 family)
MPGAVLLKLIMHYSLWLLPVISGLIGWFTNWVAIKMLFHPRNPVKVLGVTFHGIFPKRQRQFAEKLGILVSAELLSFQEIAQAISNPQNIKRIEPVIETHIDHFLRVRLAAEMPIISAFVGEKTIGKLKSAFLAELYSLFPELMEKYSETLREELDLEKIVVDKVASFSSDKLEQVLYQIMSKELQFVEILGGVLGFLIGLGQLGLTLIAL